MAKLVCGVGVNDGRYSATVNGKILKEYDVWKTFLRRCYSPKYQRVWLTYVGCSVSENFKNYSYFHEWCQNQIGFGQEGFELDKDLIFKGNKIYSEDTCLFLPSELNSLFTSCKRARGKLPVGVTLQSGRFRAQCSIDSVPSYLGYFDTPELAFQAYKQTKEAFIKLQAEKWEALIDPRAYEALLRYEVILTD